MSFIIALIEKLKENILLSSVIGILFTGGIGVGSYYLFTRSSDNTVQKENEEDKKEVVNEETTQKEEKTENEENNQEMANKKENSEDKKSEEIVQKEEKNENEENNQGIGDQEEKKENIEEIKPTFLLDYSKTTLVIQIITELIIIIFILWLSCDIGRFKNANLFNQDRFRDPAVIDMTFLKIPFKQFGGSLLLEAIPAYAIVYLFIHLLINFLLPLIAQFTSGNSYLSLLKNYWKKHFNNLGGCFIFVLSWIIVPILIIYAACWYNRSVAISLNGNKGNGGNPNGNLGNNNNVDPNAPPFNNNIPGNNNYGDPNILNQFNNNIPGNNNYGDPNILNQSLSNSFIKLPSKNEIEEFNKKKYENQQNNLGNSFTLFNK